MTYAKRTCAKCGKQSPQNLMEKKEVARKANFKSRKSVTPLTFIGAFAGSKKAKGALESWAFTTSSRKGSANAGTKTVYVCGPNVGCRAGSSSSGDSLNLLTLLLIPIGAVWVIISHLFENRSSIKSGIFKLGQFFASAFKFTRSSTKAAVKKGSSLAYAKSLRSMPDADLLKEAFIGNEFQTIACYIFMHEIANADGKFSRAEKKRIKDTFKISQKGYFVADRIMKRSLQKAVKKLLKKHILHGREFVFSIIENLFMIAAADGIIDQNELSMIEVIAKDVGLTQLEFDEIKNEKHHTLVSTGIKFRTDEIDEQVISALEDN